MGHTDFFGPGRANSQRTYATNFVSVFLALVNFKKPCLLARTLLGAPGTVDTLVAHIPLREGPKRPPLSSGEFTTNDLLSPPFV